MRVAAALVGVIMLGGCGAAGHSAAGRHPSAHPDSRTQSRARRKSAEVASPRVVSTAALPDVGTLHMVTPVVGWAETATFNSSGAVTRSALWRTVNGTRSWVRVFQQQGAFLAWSAPTADRAWVATSSHQDQAFRLWTTSDGGGHWQAFTPAVPWSDSIVTASLTVSATGMGSLLASGPVGTQTGPQALWRITDNILAPTPVYSNANTAFINASWSTPGDGWMTASSALVDDRAAVLYHTTNGGQQWTPVSLPIPTSVPSPANGHPQYVPNLFVIHPPFFVTPDDGYLVASLTDGTIAGPQVDHPVLYQTTNDQTWAPVWVGSPGSTVAQLQWVDAENGWALLIPQNNSSTRVALITTANGGHTWSSTHMPPDASANPTYDLVALSPTEAIVCAVLPRGRLRVYTTTDGGHTWQVGSR